MLPAAAGATVFVHAQTTRLRYYAAVDAAVQRFSSKEVIMKWAGMYLVGFIVLVGGVLAALWKLGILANIGTTWTVIGVVIVIGFGIMISVSNSGSKENIEIDRN
jgi:hypothetical protein